MLVSAAREDVNIERAGRDTCRSIGKASEARRAAAVR